TNWSEKFFGGTSNNTDVYANVTGGTDNASFMLSAGYNRSTYNFPGDFAENRLTIHSSFYYTSRNNKFDVNFGTDFSYARNNNAAQPSALTTFATPPNAPDLLDEDGNLLWNYKGADLTFHQQYAYLHQPY